MSTPTPDAPKTEPMIFGLFPQTMVVDGLQKVLVAGGATLVTHGYIDQTSEASIASALAGLLIVIATAIWGAIGKTKANKIAMAAAVPGVQQIVVTSQALADSQSVKVVTPADIKAGNAPPLTGTIPNPGTTGLY